MEYRQPTEVEIKESFRQYAAENGIELPDNIIADGKIHRFRLSNESKDKKSGAYKLYTDGRPAGFLQDFKSGFKENWKFTSENYQAPALTPAQREQQKEEFERRVQQALIEQQQDYDKAAIEARKEWNKTKPAASHPFADAKGVRLHNARVSEYRGIQQLIIPFQNKDGKLVSLQRIKENGFKEDGSVQFQKMNLTGGKKSGAFSILNRMESPKIIAIAEGFATTASVIEDSYSVKNKIMGVMAIDAGNLKAVAESMRELHPNAAILVFGDKGDKTKIGEIKAKEAAEAVGGFAAFPPIEEGDFNDYLTNDMAMSLENIINQATGKVSEVAKKAVEPIQQAERMQKTQESESLSKAQIIKNLSNQLSTDEGITKKYLTEQANIAFGGTIAEGKYSFKEAYDLMEAAVNVHLSNNYASQDLGATDAHQAGLIAISLTELTEKLPTQTVRDKEMDRMQQFSTPPALSYVANWVANVNNTDTMLEPSAGTGDLAIWSKMAGAKVVLNELSDRRAEILSITFPGTRIIKENAEQLHNILPDDVKPTVIVMNPPFSSSVGVQSKNSSTNGVKHIEQALLRLADNGRLVAIVGEGMAADKPAFKEWWRKTQDKYNVRANIGIDKAFKKYGTSWGTQILVIDKNGATKQPVLTRKVETVADLPQLLEGIKNERPNIESSRIEPTSSKPTKTTRSELQPEHDTGDIGIDEVGSHRRSEHGNSDPRIGNGQSGVSEFSVQPGQNTRADNESANHDGQRGRNVLRAGREPDGRSSGATGNLSNESYSAIGEKLEMTDGGTSLVPVVIRSLEKEAPNIESKTPDSAKSDISDSIFSNYAPQKLEIQGAKQHPSPLVQSAAMASVEPPAPAYSPKLPLEVINNGLLSLAQLESVVYAGQSHNEILPNGDRKGFFIGDGTGVGKGREIAGVILDNFMQGRKKALWVSFSQDLIKDAQRDFSGVGGDDRLIFSQGKIKASNSIQNQEGVLFTSYSTLASGSKQQANGKGQEQGKSRLDQITEWLGKDFDGVIAFDESHSMGNAIPIKGKRGVAKPSQRALAGIELQKALPKARVVYVSATGATEINNLAYADRLGLWGEGTAFANVQTFVNEVSSGGVAAMELVSRDMKSLGNYISRSLSYDGVTYQRMEHNLTPLQTDVYNELASAWQTVLQNIDTALETTNAGGNSNAKGAALSAFWSSHQRFFNQIITSMQTPMVIDDIQKQLDLGNAVVIQLVNTNEAAQEREVAKATSNGIVLEELDFTPRQNLISYVENSFPVMQYHQVEDADGNISFEPTTDSNGNPVFNKEAIKMRDDLIKTLETIRVPDNPIDSIINYFGSDIIAEVTGRSRRFVHGKDENGEFKIIEEKRGKGSSTADAQAFQDDKKKILMFSAAGGTGFSFHADNAAINQRKRIHYILQAGWRADSAVQGFGRSHRTNQKHPPHYVLPTTDLKAQKRFVSSVARRLDQLGALTRGQRQATSQGLFTASDNLESKYAQEAVYTLFQDMYRDRVTGLNFHEVAREMGLDLIDKKTGAIKDDKIPDIPQFLNRLLSLTTTRQDTVFDAFENRLTNTVDHAKQQGIFDEGVQNFRAKNIVKTADTVVYTDQKTGAQTRMVELEVTNDKKYRNWNAISGIQKESAAKNENGGFFVGLEGKFEGKAFHLTDRHKNLNVDGKEAHKGTMRGIDEKPHYIDNAGEVLQGYRYGMSEGHYQKIPISKPITEAEAKELWNKEILEAPKTETEKINILVGAILPIWDRIKSGGNATIYRTQTDSGEQLLGRFLSEKTTQETLKNLGVASKTTDMSKEDLFASVQAGSKAILANGWVITTAKVNGETRIEVRSKQEGSSYFTPANQKLLENQGVNIERIQWQDRLFIPNSEKGLEVFSRIIASKPIVEIEESNKVSSPKIEELSVQEPKNQTTLVSQPSEQPGQLDSQKETPLQPETSKMTTRPEKVQGFEASGDIPSSEPDYGSMPDYGDIPPYYPDEYYQSTTQPEQPMPELIVGSKTEQEQNADAEKAKKIINAIENITQLELFATESPFPVAETLRDHDRLNLRARLDANESKAKQPEKEEVESAPQAKSPIAEIDNRIPPEVASKYIQVENKFFSRKNSDRPVFEDKISKLETKLNSPGVAIDLVKIATERGWKEIKITGTPEFKREVWLESQTRGLKTVGYFPTDFDKAILNERLANARTNAIEEFKPLEKTTSLDKTLLEPNPVFTQKAKKTTQAELEM